MPVTCSVRSVDGTPLDVLHAYDLGPVKYATRATIPMLGKHNGGCGHRQALVRTNPQLSRNTRFVRARLETLYQSIFRAILSHPIHHFLVLMPAGFQEMLRARVTDFDWATYTDRLSAVQLELYHRSFVGR